MSWKEAVEKGLEPKSYTYKAEEVPTGEMEVVLDFKVWAKQAMGIGCYFTQAETGLRFVLTVFRGDNDGYYMVRDCAIDFTDCPTGVAYRLKVALNSHGNPYMSAATLVEGGRKE
jgi:hypothetical protein